MKLEDIQELVHLHISELLDEMYPITRYASKFNTDARKMFLGLSYDNVLDITNEWLDEPPSVGDRTNIRVQRIERLQNSIKCYQIAKLEGIDAALVWKLTNPF